MKNYTTEFIGTFFWSLTAVLTLNNGSAAMAPLAGGSVPMVYAGGTTSGGHYSPAVTLPC